MYCQNCGMQVSDSARYCSRCGTPTQAPAQHASPFSAVPAGNPIGTHPVVVAPPHKPVAALRGQVHVLGILWTIYSIFRLLFWASGLAFRGGVMRLWMYSFPYGGDAGYPLMHFWSGAFFFTRFVSLVVGVVGIWAGVSLLRRNPDGRTIAIVAGFIALLSFPVGTLLGIYTLGVMLRQGSGEAYATLSAEPFA